MRGTSLVIGPATPPACTTAFRPAALVIAARPAYPETPREEGAEGSTFLDVAIGLTGAVLDVSVAVSAGNAGLDHAAMESASHGKFAPASCDRRAIVAVYRYVVRFHIDGRTDAADVTVGDPPWRGPYSEIPRQTSPSPAGFAY